MPASSSPDDVRQHPNPLSVMKHALSRSRLIGQAFPAQALIGLIAICGSAQGQINEDLKLLAGDGTAGDALGGSTAIADGVVATGAPGDDDNGANSGSAYLFDEATGAQLNKLLPLDGAAGDEFGFSVAVSNGMVVVGSRRDDGHGSAYLFNATTGAQLVKFVPSDGAAGDEFGFAVAMDGGVVAVGSKRDDDNGTDSGSVYLFDALSGAQVMKLLPSDGATGHNFGESVDMDNGVVAAGAHGTGFLAGSAYLFDVATGLQLTKLVPLDTHANMFFGTTIGIDDGVVVVGAWADSIFFDHSGSAYLFDVATGLQLSKLIPSDGHDRDHFGYSVAIDDGVVAIGAEQDGDSGFNGGSAYLYSAGDGSLITKVLASDGQAFDVFGSAVAVDAGTVVIGAPGDDDSGAAAGSVYLVETIGQSGQAYCFGDGTGATCPCMAFGALGTGCANTGGGGALLQGSGQTSFSNDTFQLQITGVPGAKPGLLVQANNQVAIPVGDGILCASGGSVRSQVQVTVAGATTFTNFNGSAFGAVANAGMPTNHQFWYRDPANTCSGLGFNFSNAWTTNWQP